MHTYEVIPIELSVYVQNLQKIVQVAQKIMLENLIILNVYL
jgi:hypothetical protein